MKYTLAPVLVTATEAKERETPVTFTNLTKGLIEQRYSMQDVPVLLAQLPSMISFSDGGNGIGYNYVTLRGFDQSRLSIMVNGIPQNDPEDQGVYWLRLFRHSCERIERSGTARRRKLVLRSGGHWRLDQRRHQSV